MNFQWFVARRYLTARRRQAFISVISFVSTLGVGVGVMALIIALGLMTGVQSELRDRIVGSAAHVYVYKPAGFEDVNAELAKMKSSGVIGAAPAMVGPGLLQSSASDGVFVRLKGIDPELEPQVTDIRRAMKEGSLDKLLHRSDDDRDGIILGVDLASSLGAHPGDQVTLLTLNTVLTPGRAVPLPRYFEVVGIAAFGYYDTDTSSAFVTLRSAQRALGPEASLFIQLRLANMDDAPAVRERLTEELGSQYIVEDWMGLNAPLYSALWLEKIAISLTIGLIVMVAALNIVASLILLVMEKSRDIAILRTMGASARQVRQIFVLQGLIIGLVGTTAGTVLGLLVSQIADRYQLIKLPSDVYQITYLPFRNEAADILIVVVAAVLVCLVATIYPARQAGRLDPAEALRHQ
jgi:lipoprotein-releasing system permease protein